MIRKKKFIFLGSILNYEGLINYKGASPAASFWTKGFINGLKANNQDVTILSVIWDSLFPKGELLPGDDKYLDDSFNQILINYINLSLIRDITISRGLEKKIEELICETGETIVVFNYNPTPYYCDAISKIKSKYLDVVWINIILDFDDPEVDDWNVFNKLTNKADGHIFLSWWGYENAPVRTKMHLDSGWSNDEIILDKSEINCLIFLYAGKMADYGGIKDLIAAIKLYKNRSAKFEFYGKGINKGLMELAKNDDRVVVKGFVSNAELHAACQKATAFLAPLDVNWISNKLTFPSKILSYLKYLKPIISQELPGISPVYKSILIIPKDSTAAEWSRSFAYVDQMSEIDKSKLSSKCLNLLESKTWKIEAEKVIDFVQKIINK